MATASIGPPTRCDSRAALVNTTWWSARARPRHRPGSARRWGNAALNWLAGFLTEREIPDLTSGFRAARRSGLLEFIGLLPNGFSTPTTTTLCFLKAGYSVAFEPVEARQRVGTSKIRLSSDGPKFLLIMLRVMTIFSPFRIFLPIAATAFLIGAALRRVDDLHATPHHQLLRAADRVRRDGVPRRSRLRADLGAAFRWPSMKDEEQRGRATRRWIAAAALVGLALRLAFGLFYWTNQPLTRDEREYLSLARSLAAGRGYVYDSEVLRGPRRAVRPCTGLSRVSRARRRGP